MTAKFIPGPWKSETIRYKDGDMFVRIITAYDDYDGEDCIGPETICTIGGFPTIALDGGTQCEATGRLIAAAPEMYALLKKHQAECGGSSNYGSCSACRDRESCELTNLLARINGEESK